MHNFFIYLLLVLSFIIPIGIFVLVVLLFLPRQVAILVIGLTGFTVMVVGPFWAMRLEKRLRDRLGK